MVRDARRGFAITRRPTCRMSCVAGNARSIAAITFRNPSSDSLGRTSFRSAQLAKPLLERLAGELLRRGTRQLALEERHDAPVPPFEERARGEEPNPRVRVGGPPREQQ